MQQRLGAAIAAAPHLCADRVRAPLQLRLLLLLHALRLGGAAQRRVGLVHRRRRRLVRAPACESS